MVASATAFALALGLCPAVEFAVAGEAAGATSEAGTAESQSHDISCVHNAAVVGGPAETASDDALPTSEGCELPIVNPYPDPEPIAPPSGVVADSYPKSIVDASVTGVPSSARFTGRAIVPDPIVKLDGTALRKGIDYTVDCSNSVNVGIATVVIAGMGNYSGSLTKTFAIAKAKIKKAEVIVKERKIKKGKAAKPKPIVKLDGRKLKLNRDYTLSYKNNKKKGKGTVIVRGIGNYTGKATAKFSIK